MRDRSVFPVAPGWGSYAARRQALGYLFEEVVAARDGEQYEAQRPARVDGLHLARLRTLRALVDYADVIESLGWPVPRGVQTDIMLRRSLCGPLRLPT